MAKDKYGATLFRLRFRTNNAAFCEGGGAEVARILREIADEVESCGAPECADGPVRDINGNSVGEWDLSLP